MKRHLLVLSLLALLATPTLGRAQVSAVPPMMNFQGRLTKPDGTPVPDGTYSVRFSLWTAASGGTEKWNQAINPVNVSKGVFAVLLNVANLPTLFDGNLWLEIKIGNNTPLTPRQSLVSVAYAMKANTVPDGSITDAKIVNVDWSKITGAPSSPLALPFVGSTNSANPAFKVTNTGTGYGGSFTSASGNASLYAAGGAFNGLYAETTDPYGNGVKGVGDGGVNAVGVYGSSASGMGVLGEGFSGPGVYGVSYSGIAVYGGSSTGYGGYFTSSSGIASLYVTGATSSGLYAESTAYKGRGIQGIANNGPQAYNDSAAASGVYGASSYGHGVEGDSPHGDGVFGHSSNWAGVYGKSATGWGVYGESTYLAGFFDGDVSTTGSYQNMSDARYKTNVQTFPNGLEAILNLRGVTFDWKREEFKNRHFKEGKQIGFIAQEVEKILPELVRTDHEGYKSVAYQNVVPVLVEAVKTLNARVEDKQKQLDRKDAELTALKVQVEALAQAVQQLQARQK